MIKLKQKNHCNQLNGQQNQSSGLEKVYSGEDLYVLN